jgi:hypothetical protein
MLPAVGSPTLSLKSKRGGSTNVTGGRLANPVTAHGATNYIIKDALHLVIFMDIDDVK